VASNGNKKNPIQDRDSASNSQINPTKHCAVSNNDDVGYDANDTYESASDLCGDLANRFTSFSINFLAPVGHNSIVKNLPIPTVGICYKAAYIPAREIINNLLAVWIDVMFFHTEHEEDWLDKSGNYATEFLCDLHQNFSITKDILMNT
jgi:hypothetical protein